MKTQYFVTGDFCKANIERFGDSFSLFIEIEKDGITPINELLENAVIEQYKPKPGCYFNSNGHVSFKTIALL